VVADTADCEELTQAVAERRPEVVVLDERHSAYLSGLSDTCTGVVILFAAASPGRLLDWLRAGARGVVDVAADDLAEAVRVVGSGGEYISPTLTGALLTGIRASPAVPALRRRTPGLLTVRENEVLKLLCGGLANREIAKALHVSEKTVKFHVSNVLAKLDMRTRAQLIASQHTQVSGLGRR
jgi:DNA-binding NarL/FixJ family response regulator